jgi:hypothetical protein
MVFPLRAVQGMGQRPKSILWTHLLLSQKHSRTTRSAALAVLPLADVFAAAADAISFEYCHPTSRKFLMVVG